MTLLASDKCTQYAAQKALGPLAGKLAYGAVNLGIDVTAGRHHNHPQARKMRKQRWVKLQQRHKRVLQLKLKKAPSDRLSGGLGPKAHLCTEWMSMVSVQMSWKNFGPWPEQHRMTTSKDAKQICTGRYLLFPTLYTCVQLPQRDGRNKYGIQRWQVHYHVMQMGYQLLKSSSTTKM